MNSPTGIAEGVRRRPGFGIRQARVMPRASAPGEAASTRLDARASAVIERLVHLTAREFRRALHASYLEGLHEAQQADQVHDVLATWTRRLHAFEAIEREAMTAPQAMRQGHAA